MFNVEKIVIIILSALILILSMILILPNIQNNNEIIKQTNITLEDKIEYANNNADKEMKKLAQNIIIITIIGLIIILFIITSITTLNGIEQILQQKKE